MDLNRRKIIAGGVVLGGVSATMPLKGQSAETTRGPRPPSLKFAFQAIVAIGEPVEVGRVDGQRKRIVPIIGGTFAGPTVRGAIVPGGADWQTIREDGTAEIFARYTLRADDGTVISIANPGYRHGPPEVLARIAHGEDVEPALYYFRTTPQFDVAENSRHAWMGRNVFVSTAARYATRVVVDVYQVL